MTEPLKNAIEQANRINGPKTLPIPSYVFYLSAIVIYIVAAVLPNKLMGSLLVLVAIVIAPYPIIFRFTQRKRRKRAVRGHIIKTIYENLGESIEVKDTNSGNFQINDKEWKLSYSAPHGKMTHSHNHSVIGFGNITEPGDTYRSHQRNGLHLLIFPSRPFSGELEIRYKPGIKEGINEDATLFEQYFDIHATHQNEYELLINDRVKVILLRLLAWGRRPLIYGYNQSIWVHLSYIHEMKISVPLKENEVDFLSQLLTAVKLLSDEMAENVKTMNS